ncbi:MAG: hypothetical protein ACM3X7_10715 [Solirubrobacterales bacterium]
MQSSFKVIKNSNISEGRKDINTNFVKKEKQTSHVVENDTVIYKPMDSYENIGNTIINEAKRKSELLMSTTYEELERMRKDVYESAYKEGYEMGAREGLKVAYEEAYQQNIQKAQADALELFENAEKSLMDANLMLQKYMKDKENEIKNLIENAVESILRHEVKDKDSMNRSITEVLEAFKDSKIFIIKCSSIYYNELKSKVETWKEKLPFNGEIFVICDDSLTEGHVIVKRDNGITEISIEESMIKLRDILFSEE